MATSLRCAPVERGRAPEHRFAGSPVERFLHACGWTGPVRLTVEDLAGVPLGPTLALDQPFIVVGRRETADVTLDHPEFSRNHLYLQVIAGRVFCIDLFSRTGTFWGNERRSWGWIEPGAAVRIGNVRLRPSNHPFDTRSGEAESTALPISRSFGSQGCEDVVLELMSAETSPNPAWWINRAIFLIGRSPACKLHLPDSSCAKIHASLVRTPLGVWLVDMRSSTGTWLNGEPVKCVRIGNGDEITIGPYCLKVHAGIPATQILSANGLPALRETPDLNMVTLAGSGPAEGAQVLSPADGAGRDALTLELLREIGQQRAESAEQHRQLIALFYRMHQEQMALIVGELERLRQLVDARPQGGSSRATIIPTPENPLLNGVPTQLTLLAPATPLASPRTASSASVSLDDASRHSSSPISLPVNGASGETAAAISDSNTDFHLVLAQRLAAHKDDSGRMKTLIDWLAGLHNNLIGA